MAGVDIPAWMQGRAFLGAQKEKSREFVFSHRDRFDESYDMMRSVRDEKYRYVRNYFTNQPYILRLPFRDQSPIMKVMLRLHAEDKLQGPQKLWFSVSRPAEELYDCQADPHHIHNVADDPAYKNELDRLSAVLDEWMDDTHDLGGTPESELKRRWWPNGVKPKTSCVWFIPNAESNRSAKRIVEETAEFNHPAMINFYCATEGASMLYSVDEGAEVRWTIVNGPIRLAKGKTTIRARAIRYGYEESDEARCEILVQ